MTNEHKTKLPGFDDEWLIILNTNCKQDCLDSFWIWTSIMSLCFSICSIWILNLRIMILKLALCAKIPFPQLELIWMSMCSYIHVLFLFTAIIKFNQFLCLIIILMENFALVYLFKHILKVSCLIIWSALDASELFQCIVSMHFILMLSLTIVSQPSHYI